MQSTMQPAACRGEVQILPDFCRIFQIRSRRNVQGTRRVPGGYPGGYPGGSPQFAFSRKLPHTAPPRIIQQLRPAASGRSPRREIGLLHRPVRIERRPAGCRGVCRGAILEPGGSVRGERANFRGIVLGCIRIRIRSRSVFEKKENLGVCAKQKVRLTRLGKYYVVQYYTLYRCSEKSISLFRLRFVSKPNVASKQ